MTSDVPTDPVADRHALALDIARHAGALAHEYWLARADLEIIAKGGAQDLVSEADRAVERLIREAVAARFPDDGFLGEEYGATDSRSGFTWVIDPIDGTVPYLHGMPNWCVAMALVSGDDCVAGVIEVPTHGETFAALAGQGSTLNGRPLRLHGDLTLATGLTAIGASSTTSPDTAATAIRQVMSEGGMFFRNGSGALMLAYVAASRLAGYFEPVMYAWDCRAGLLIIAEAGGRTAPFRPEGGAAGRGPVLAAAPGAFDDLMRICWPTGRSPH
jgi:myo-inositol-1(or 4)-monophosphatase